MQPVSKPARVRPRRSPPYALSLAALAIAAAAAGGWWWSADSTVVVRRERGLNILLITIDTLRADAVGAYGHAGARTPWIDRLASGGVRFEQARAHNVVTLPSHATVLSGRYPYEHGVRDNAGFRVPASLETLPTILSAQGYRTAAFISAFPLDSRFGLDRGFDEYDDRFVGVHPQAAFVVQERTGAETVTLARAWLDRPDPRPAFCWVHLYEPHFPYPQGYDADVAAADAALAPLLEPLLATGDARTLIVLTSDHGESLGDHGESTHGIFAYEPTLRVPLIIHQPRLLAPAVVSAAARLIDVLPTVLDAVDLPAPAGLPGRSLLPLAWGEEALESITYFEAMSGQLNRGWAPLHGVIRGTTKYIRLPIPELYDLAADPAERHNLASADPALAGELELVVTSSLEAQSAAARTTESRESVERLRSLGYVTSAPHVPRRDFTPDDDPKRLIALDGVLQEVVARYLEGDVAGARERCRELVRRRPSMPVALLHLAHLERANGDLSAGIDALRDAIALAPGDVTAVSLLGAYLGEAGRPQEAVAWLEGYAAAEDADPQVLVAYALALGKLGQHARAVEPLDRLVARDPSNARALVERGTVHMMAGHRDRARLDFVGALERHPSAARAHTSLGVLAVEEGNIADATRHWAQAVALDGAEHQALLALGLFHWRAGRHDAATVYLDFFEAFAPRARYARELAGVREVRSK
jgi:arylsulfatase A-like enzyme/Tfp pilus assembly protein PilF